jgi:hypothetical protein
MHPDRDSNFRQPHRNSEHLLQLLWLLGQRVTQVTLLHSPEEALPARLQHRRQNDQLRKTVEVA